ncbi:MAG: flagellar motor switch protein FliG [Rhodobacterales bacterium]|nr:MAG: flagellar motor switch protein FliG [Rhodobacterales bacterium]
MTLTQREKAAIIVRFLAAEGVKLPLSMLPAGMQTELASQLTRMRFVNRATLKAVVEEFAAAIEDVGLAFPRDMEGALQMLDGSISASTASRIRKAQGVRLCGNPWEKIAGADVEKLLPILEEEALEVAAVLLSKLKVSTAATLLSRLPGPRARAVVHAMSLTSAVSPEVVEKIGISIAEQLEAQPVKAFPDGPVERVGAILNFSPAQTREDVLNGLDEDDRGFAEEVRKAIFTFAHIPARVDPRDVPKFTKEVEQEVLVTALAGATGKMEETAEFILGAMSKRMAEQLREEMTERGKVKPKEAEAAMTEIVAAIRELEAAGDLLLIAEEEDDE